MNIRSGTVSLLCFVLPLLYSRQIRIPKMSRHGRLIATTFNSTSITSPTFDQYAAKFSPSMSNAKNDSDCEVKPSKSDGRRMPQSITEEYSVTDGTMLCSKPNNVQK